LSMATYFFGIPAPLRRFDALIPPEYTPIPIEQRHLTLYYVGPARNVDELCRALRALNVESFIVTFRGLRPFPSHSRPRYLAAVPLEECWSTLQRLRDDLARLVPISDDRYAAFRPHVSIAATRQKPSVDLLRSVERAIRASQAVTETLVVERVCLMRALGGLVEPLCCRSV